MLKQTWSSVGMAILHTRFAFSQGNDIFICQFFLLVQKLTGGVLLLRNKFLIILYRGKDFLPSEVAKVVAEREMELTRCQLQEEAARLKASEAIPVMDELPINTGIMGSLSEFHSVLSEIQNLEEGNYQAEVQLKAKQERLRKELRVHEKKFFIVRFCS